MRLVRDAAAVLGLVACLVLTGAAGVARGAGGAVNLRATPAVKQGLRAAFLAHADPSIRAGVRGPLPGSVYYGRSGGLEWALATFSLPRVGTTDQPERFRRRPGGKWTDLGAGSRTPGCRPPTATTRP
jgi:hypothetical protein